MDVDFDDHQLALIETDRAADTQLPVAVIQTARQRLTVIRAAPDEYTMLAWRSLGYERASEESSHERFVRIGSDWKMHLRLDRIDVPTKVTITAISAQR